MVDHAGVRVGPPVDVVNEIAARGWRGRDSERLGGWLLRAAEGWTGRANSVLPLGEPGLPLDDALTFVRQWYGERGLPARFQVPLPLCAPLDAELGQRGWTAYNPTFFLTGDISALVGALPELPGLPAVTLAAVPSSEWLAAYHYRGGALPAVAAAVMVDAERPVFATVTLEGQVAAIGRAVVDDDWCGVTALEVVEAFRRRGLARHLLRGLLLWARGESARHVYLQVAETNEPALALYRGLDMTAHHRYHYRLQPDS